MKISEITKIRFLAIVLCLFLLPAMPASAESKDPDPAVNPALAALIKSGAKFFYMGRSAGLDGWLAVKDGQTQIVYKPPNNAYVLVGYLFGPQGENLTAPQVKQLTATNKDLAQLAAVAPENDLPASDVALSEALPKEDPAVAKLLKAAQDESLPVGERLMKTLDKAPSVSLGTNDKAPQLYVIAMPGCPNCKKFWDGFHDPVQKGTIRLRLYPVAPRGSDFEKTAAELFKTPDPLAAWDKDSNGTPAAPTNSADVAALEQVRTDTGVSAQWHISAIPYLLYRGKDGQVKVVQGTPDDPKVVLDDINAAAAPAAVSVGTSKP